MAHEFISVTNAALGIDKSGIHSRDLTELEADAVRILNDKAKGIGSALSALQLACALFDGASIEQDKRNVRHLVNHLIVSHRIPICSMSGKDGGYFFPITKDEETLVYNARKKRAITGLVKMSQGRKNALVDSAEQLVLFMDNPDNQKAIERLQLVPDEGPLPAWVQLVTRLLDKLSRDPKRYAIEICELQRQFGDMFVPRETMKQLRTAAKTINTLLDDVGRMI